MSNENSQLNINNISILKHAKNNIDDINSMLMRHVENLDRENLALKDAINELHVDNLKKDNAIDESHRIIVKINEEYSKLVKECKSIESYSKELEEENEELKTAYNGADKTHGLFERLNKKSESLRNENERLKNEAQTLKAAMQAKTAETLKLEKEIKEKNTLHSEYKNKSEYLEKQLSDRETIIHDYEARLQELNSIMAKKEEEIKVLLKLSQEFGSENRYNIEELTKQAVNTIKIFYNTINNNNSGDYRQIILNGRVVFYPGKEGVSSFKKNLENSLKDNKASFLLEEALTEVNQISHLSSVPKEYLANLAFKNEILKCELFSSLIREMNFTKYVKDLVGEDKRDQNEINDNLVTDNNSIDFIVNYIENLKSKAEDYDKLKKENSTLCENKKALEEVINKIKENMRAYTERMKDQFSNSETRLSNVIKTNKEFNDKLQSELRKRMDAEEEVKRLGLENERLILNNDSKTNGKYSYLINLQIRSNTTNILIPGSLPSKVINLNESFNELHYQQKKEENIKLRDEIIRLKSETRDKQSHIEDLLQKLKSKAFPSHTLLTSTYNLELVSGYEPSIIKQDLTFTPKTKYFEENKSDLHCGNLIDKIHDFRTNTLKYSAFKDLKQFYISYQMDMDKMNSKIEEVTAKLSKTESVFAQENPEKPIKVQQVREILSQVLKLVSLFAVFISKYNKDINHYTRNLKKLFDFVNKIVYKELNTTSVNYTVMKSVNNGNKLSQELIRMIYEMNHKVFIPTDLKNIYYAYENRSIYEIIEIFKLNCEIVKNNMVDKLDFESEFSEIDESFSNKYTHHKRNSEILMTNNYKVVNDRLLKLKKFEFDFTNLTEILKNFLVVQEIILKMIFDDADISLNETFKLEKYMKNKYDCLDKILFIAEETILYKCNEYDENLFFMKKFSISFLKNQKSVLMMTVSEY